MEPFVTHSELNEAIDGVLERIAETEEKLRTEFQGAFQFEITRFDDHLNDQDEKLVWINRWTLGLLVMVMGSLITGIIYLKF